MRAAGDECRAVWLSPVDDIDIHGDLKGLKDANAVEAVRIPGYWWGTRATDGSAGQPAAPNEKVIILFHGGGYVLGSAHPKEASSQIARVIISHAQGTFSRLLAVDYRLSRAAPLSAPANPIPAALLDGLAAVHYVVYNIGVHPRNIILCGDSAGGNLALGLARYLRDAPIPKGKSADEVGSKSLLPGGLLLQSPWCDPASTHIPERVGPNCSFVRNAHCDIVGRNPYSEERPWMGMSAYSFRGLSGRSMQLSDIAKSPLLSPGSLDLDLVEPSTSGSEAATFAGYPPTYISVGGREILFDEIVTTAERLQRAAPYPCIASESDTPWVTLDNEPEMFHDFCGTGPVCAVETERTVKRMVEWVISLPQPSAYPL